MKFRFWRIVLCCAILLLPTLTLALPQHTAIPQHSLAPQTYAIAAKSRLYINSTALRCNGELLLSANPTNTNPTTSPTNVESTSVSLELHAKPKTQHPTLESIHLLISISKDNLPHLLQDPSYIQGTLTINNNISQPITLQARLKIKRGKLHTLKLSSKISSHYLAPKNGRAKLKATLILSELL